MKSGEDSFVLRSVLSTGMRYGLEEVKSDGKQNLFSYPLNDHIQYKEIEIKKGSVEKYRPFVKQIWASAFFFLIAADYSRYFLKRMRI